MRPDLDDPAQLAAYRRELRRLGLVPRLLGFLLVVAGTGIIIYAQRAGVTGGPLRPVGWAMIAVGWLNLIAVMVYRARYHRARISEDQGWP
jgi:hypothetical protein